MAKAALQHACSECGYTTGKWLGRCPACGAWGSLVEERALAPAPGVRGAPGRRPAAPPPRRGRDRRGRADPDRRPRARPRARRRPRPRQPRPRLRRPRDRQVHAPAHGPPGHVQGAEGGARHRRGVLGAGEAPRRPARRRRRRPHPRRDEPGRGLRDARARAARGLRRRLRPDALRARARLGARLRGAGARGGRALPARGQGAGHRDVPRRPRDEGGLRRRPARARAPRRLRPPLRGRPLPLAPDPARGEEPLRLDERAGRLRDDLGRARRASTTPPSSSAIPTRSSPAPPSSARSRARGRSCSRCRRSSRRPTWPCRGGSARASTRSASP